MDKIFDVHTDILYDVYTSLKKGDLNRFENYHLAQLKESVIGGGVWTLYSPDEFNLFLALKETLAVIDFKKLGNFPVILGLESLRNLQSIEEFERIYQLGFRHAMLTWNEENRYATGIKGPSERGLTDEGKRVLDFMENKNMIIDVSHLNEKSFYDVLEYTNHNIIASHSNAKAICDHPRNLDDNQLRKLKSVDGLLGLTTVGSFIATEKGERTLARFIEHVKHAVSIMGIDNICLGFDFMDYFDESVGSNIPEVFNAKDAYKVIDALKEAGFSDVDIKKITHDNFYQRYQSLIYNGGKTDE